MNKEILKFEAVWCMPCKTLSKTLEHSDFEDVTIKKIDIDEESNSELVEKYNIRSIPTLVYFKDGIEIGTTIGAISKEQILNIYKNH